MAFQRHQNETLTTPLPPHLGVIHVKICAKIRIFHLQMIKLSYKVVSYNNLKWQSCSFPLEGNRETFSKLMHIFTFCND